MRSTSKKIRTRVIKTMAALALTAGATTFSSGGCTQQFLDFTGLEFGTGFRSGNLNQGLPTGGYDDCRTDPYLPWC